MEISVPNYKHSFKALVVLRNPIHHTPVGQAEAVTRPTGQTLQERELRRSSGSDVDQETKTLLESERKRVSMLETTLVTKETELGKVRLDLASSQSLLEQTQKDLKVSATECSRREKEPSPENMR